MLQETTNKHVCFNLYFIICNILAPPTNDSDEYTCMFGPENLYNYSFEKILS